MSEEIVPDEEQDERSPEIVHDDIMQRLLDYQRQLREGVSPSEAAEAGAAPPERPMIDHAAAEALTATKTETDIVVDLTRAEAELEATESVVVEEVPAAEPFETVEHVWDDTAVTAPSVSSTDLAARVAELEGTLARVSAMIGELRDRFQDMAIASDERLAAVEEAISTARSPDTA